MLLVISYGINVQTGFSREEQNVMKILMELYCAWKYGCKREKLQNALVVGKKIRIYLFAEK